MSRNPKDPEDTEALSRRPIVSQATPANTILAIVVGVIVVLLGIGLVSIFEDSIRGHKPDRKEPMQEAKP